MANLSLVFEGETSDFNRQVVNINDDYSIIVFRANKWKRYAPVSNQGLYFPGWNSDEKHYLPVNDDYIAEWYVRPWLLYKWDKVNNKYTLDNTRQETFFREVVNTANYNYYTSSTSWIPTPFSYGQPKGRKGYVIDTYPIKEVNAAEPLYDLTVLGDYSRRGWFRDNFQGKDFDVTLIAKHVSAYAISSVVNTSGWMLSSMRYSYTLELNSEYYGGYSLQPPNSSYYISAFSSNNIRNNGLLEIFMTVSDKRVVESVNK